MPVRNLLIKLLFIRLRHRHILLSKQPSGNFKVNSTSYWFVRIKELTFHDALIGAIFL